MKCLQGARSSLHPHCPVGVPSSAKRVRVPLGHPLIEGDLARLRHLQLLLLCVIPGQEDDGEHLRPFHGGEKHTCSTVLSRPGLGKYYRSTAGGGGGGRAAINCKARQIMAQWSQPQHLPHPERFAYILCTCLHYRLPVRLNHMQFLILLDAGSHWWRFRYPLTSHGLQCGSKHVVQFRGCMVNSLLAQQQD